MLESHGWKVLCRGDKMWLRVRDLVDHFSSSFPLPCMTQRETPAAFWTKEDETHLLNFLFDHLASGGMGPTSKWQLLPLPLSRWGSSTPREGQKLQRHAKTSGVWFVAIPFCSFMLSFFPSSVISSVLSRLSRTTLVGPGQMMGVQTSPRLRLAIRNG